jgi:nicotinamidase-related amidase
LGPNEVVIYKPRWGAFYATPLETYLRKHAVSTLIISGCNFPNCPRTSVYEASERDFLIILVEDAVSGLYVRGRDEIKGIGVAIQTTEEFLSQLNRTLP